MIFENPNILWLLLALPPLLLGLGFWGWWAKKGAVALFPFMLRSIRSKQIEKYAIATVLVVMLILALALPKVSYIAPPPEEKSGEIILLVDVSGSMASRTDPSASSRLERIKSIIYDIINDMEELGQVKISLCGFTDIARSHVPLVGIEDYPYLEESVRKVLNVYSTPGGSTSLGQPILDVAAKFSEDAEDKIIIMLSDGEPFYWGASRITDAEALVIGEASAKAIEDDITIITIGVGEPEGAKVPLYDSDGNFTGGYAQKDKGIDFIFYLEDDVLKDIAARSGGDYFYEKDLGGLTEFIEDNLGTVDPEDAIAEEEEAYHYVANWFILASLPVWVIFARRHVLG